MKTVTLLGIGGQGSKAIGDVRGSQHYQINKVYVNPPGEVQRNHKDKMLYIPFEYELGAWSPEYPLKIWFLESRNQELINSYVQHSDIVLISLGIGGKNTLVAKHLIMYLKEAFSEKLVYLIGSVPFREESDYLHNYITSNMMNFLQKSKIPYTIIENRYIRKGFDSYQKAYEESYHYISRILEGFMAVSASKEISVIKSILSSGLVYYNEYKISDSAKESAEEMLSYRADGVSAIAVMYSNRIFVKNLNEIYRDLEKEYGLVDCIYCDYAAIRQNVVFVRLLAKARSDSRIQIRELQVW